jgi:hypothetical protein
MYSFSILDKKTKKSKSPHPPYEKFGILDGTKDTHENSGILHFAFHGELNTALFVLTNLKSKIGLKKNPQTKNNLPVPYGIIHFTRTQTNLETQPHIVVHDRDPPQLEPHPFSKPPRTSISALISTHASIFASFLRLPFSSQLMVPFSPLPSVSPFSSHILFPNIFLCTVCATVLHLAVAGGTSAHTIAMAHLPSPSPSPLPLFSTIPLPLPQRPRLFFSRTNCDNPANSDSDL